MKLASLACLAALCLTAPLAHAAPGEPAVAEQTRKEAVPASQRPAPVKADGAAKENAAKGETAAAHAERTGGASTASGRERRRRSYAACNRASHQRGLRGGKRRRFLIRCRLGYERTRTPQHQAPAPAPAPARKP